MPFELYQINVVRAVYFHYSYIFSVNRNFCFFSLLCIITIACFILIFKVCDRGNKTELISCMQNVMTSRNVLDLHDNSVRPPCVILNTSNEIVSFKLIEVTTIRIQSVLKNPRILHMYT